MKDGWSTIEIGGKRAEVFDPLGNDRPRFGTLFLHGYGLETLHDRSAFTRPLAELGLACVCPHGQHSWWVERICGEFDTHMTAERYVLDHVIPFFQSRWGIVPRDIGLQGISMGGQGALRLAFKHAPMFSVVAAISPALEYDQLYGHGSELDAMYDSKEQCRQDTAVMHLPPSHAPPHIFFCTDPEDQHWYRGADRLHEKMDALGVAHTVDLTTRAGAHSWEYFNHMAERVQRFIFDALVQESRRLL